jgi:intracellular multiplication protein IcmK
MFTTLKRIRINIIFSYLVLVYLSVYLKTGNCEEVSELQQLEQLANIQRENNKPVELGSNSADLTAANNTSIPIGESSEFEVETKKKEKPDPHREKAFDQVLDNLYPLTPEQILEMRDRHEDTSRAKEITTISPPKPVITSQFVRLAPGTTPPIVRLAEGFVSALVFLDSTGAPWPIESYNLSDPSSFNLSWNKVDNIIVVQAKKMFKDGNLIVRLENLSTPVGVSLIPGQKEIDYRRELRVQGRGPNAKPFAGDQYPEKENSVLLGVLDGVPPVGSMAVDSSHAVVESWRLGEKMYIRTPSKVLSPAWISSLKSADGMQVYEMRVTSSLLISNKGKVETVYFKG